MIAVHTLDEQVGSSFNSERLIASLSSLYGALALILASVGLYGVAAYTVSRRTNEIGIRMALGANRPRVIAMVVQQAISPIGLGLLIGMPLVVAGGRAIASQLFGLTAFDPIVIGTAITTLAIASVAATMIPARRASAIDPIRALRAE